MLTIRNCAEVRKAVTMSDNTNPEILHILAQQWDQLSAGSPRHRQRWQRC
jgi:hypothetical protein